MLMSNEQLEQQIEELVRARFAAYRSTVMAAVERALAAAMGEPARVAAPARQRKKTTSRVSGPRRTAEELEILTEHLHAEVCATPGETMAVLAVKLEMSARSLQISATRLKRAGLVRTTGQRAQTRYFPMVKDEPTARVPLVVVGSGS